MCVRVLHVVPPHLHPGTRQQILWVATEIPPTEVESHVFTLDEPSRWSAALQEARVPVYRVTFRRFAELAFWRRYLRTLHRTTADVIHVWQGAEHLPFSLAAAVCRRPMVVSHERSERRVGLLAQWFARGSRRKATLISDFSLDDGFPANQVIPWGIPASREEPSDATAAIAAERYLRESLHIDDHAHLIGVVARLEPHEGLKDAIWAIDLLKVVRDDVHLLILGEGLQEQRLRKFIQQTHTTDRIHFVTDYRAVELLPQLSCFWRTNLTSTNPTIGLMAAAQGLPIVATNLPSHRVWIEDGKSGHLFPPGNPALLARKTQLLLESPSMRTALGNELRERVERSYRLDDFLEGLAAVYQGK